MDFLFVILLFFLLGLHDDLFFFMVCGIHEERESSSRIDYKLCTPKLNGLTTQKKKLGISLTTAFLFLCAQNINGLKMNALTD